MRGRRNHQRNQHACDPRCSQFGNGDRAGAADDDVGRRVARRHVVDERDDFGFDAGLPIERSHGIDVLRAALMDHVRT